MNTNDIFSCVYDTDDVAAPVSNAVSLSAVPTSALFTPTTPDAGVSALNAVLLSWRGLPAGTTLIQLAINAVGDDHDVGYQEIDWPVGPAGSVHLSTWDGTNTWLATTDYEIELVLNTGATFGTTTVSMGKCFTQTLTSAVPGHVTISWVNAPALTIATQLSLLPVGAGWNGGTISLVAPAYTTPIGSHTITSGLTSGQPVSISSFFYYDSGPAGDLNSGIATASVDVF